MRFLDMQTRRQARLLALQALFANEFLNEDPQSIYIRICESLHQPGSDFALQLVLVTSENSEELSELIRLHLRNWDIKRVATLDKVLIRMALSEIMFFPDIPVEVTINEALEISKEFCTLKSSKFVNGILDSIYQELKRNNNIQKNISTNLFIPHNDFKRDKIK